VVTTASGSVSRSDADAVWIAQRCSNAVAAELAIACQSSVFRSHLNEAGKSARVLPGSAVPSRGAIETVSCIHLRGPNDAAEAIHGALGNGPRQPQIRGNMLGYSPYHYSLCARALRRALALRHIRCTGRRNTSKA
jgi:hypothetical protein